MEQTENVEPVVAEVAGSSTTKRRAPLPPMSLSPLQTSTPVGTVPSPVKMMKLDEEDVDSAEAENGVVAETLNKQPKDDQTADVLTSQRSRDNDSRGKLASNATKKTTAMGHVSSATLIFGGGASAASGGDVAKLTPAKVAIIHKPGPSASKGSSESSADDSMVDEPTKQPVAARLAAWQTKQAPAASQEPLAVASRVKNYERKITAESTSEKSKTPVNLRPQVDLSSSKSTVITSVKMSPIKSGGAAVSVRSPVKSVLTSPQKLSPATRAIQERLTQICEAGTKNEAVDRERRERAAELASVENRWHGSSDNSAPSVSSFKYT